MNIQELLEAINREHQLLLNYYRESARIIYDELTDNPEQYNNTIKSIMEAFVKESNPETANVYEKEPKSRIGGIASTINPKQKIQDHIKKIILSIIQGNNTNFEKIYELLNTNLERISDYTLSDDIIISGMLKYTTPLLYKYFYQYYREYEFEYNGSEYSGLEYREMVMRSLYSNEIPKIMNIIDTPIRDIVNDYQFDEVWTDSGNIFIKKYIRSLLKYNNDEDIFKLVKNIISSNDKFKITPTTKELNNLLRTVYSEMNHIEKAGESGNEDKFNNLMDVLRQGNNHLKKMIAEISRKLPSYLIRNRDKLLVINSPTNMALHTNQYGKRPYPNPYNPSEDDIAPNIANKMIKRRDHLIRKYKGKDYSDLKTDQDRAEFQELEDLLNEPRKLDNDLYNARDNNTLRQARSLSQRQNLRRLNKNSE